MRNEHGKAVLIGLGFFITCMFWSVYCTYVPLILNTHITDTILIGIVTAVMNALAALLHPFFGALSDKTKTRIGRRLPYILIGIPVSALCFVLIPRTQSFVLFLVTLAVFNVVMSAWRTPAFALLSDLIPAGFRSQANGIINLMGGLGTILALTVGGMLFNKAGLQLPFLASAALAVLVLLLLVIFLREPPNPAASDAHNPDGLDTGTVLRKLSDLRADGKNRDLMSTLLSLLFYSLATGAVETFFSLYATTSLRDAEGNLLTGGDAGFLIALFSLPFMLFSVPAGFIAARLGSHRTILLGLAGIACLFPVIYFLNLSAVLFVALVLSGMCWALIGVNYLPAVTELAEPASYGKYTGYYHIIAFGGSVVSPPLFGLVRNITGSYKILFVYSALSCLAAAVPLIGAARHPSDRMSRTRR